MYPDNSWYGHRFILTKYCKSIDKEIFATIQHGWYSEHEIKAINLSKRKLLIAPYLSWDNKFNKFYGLKARTIPIGSPFLYLDKIIEKKEISPKGTIYFPPHSVAEDYQANHMGLRAILKHHEAIEELKKTGEAPFTVSLYYEDYKNIEIRKIYESNGWNMVTFGDRNNKSFLYSVYNEKDPPSYLFCFTIHNSFIFLLSPSFYIKSTLPAPE